MVWQGTHEPSTRLWILPLNPITPPDNLHVHTNTAGTQYAGNAYHITPKEDLILYPHKCLFCPPKLTLIKAIKNNQLTTWPGLTATEVDKYLPDSSPETDKFHMKRQSKVLRTTQNNLKEKLEVIEMEQDIHPPIEREKTSNILTSITKVENKDGIIYVNNTGNLPIGSIEGYIYIFILYYWTTNEILKAPIKDTKYETMIEDFQTHIKYITKRGFKPSFNIIDYVALKAIKVYLQEENIQMQSVEPHNHQVNAA